MATLLVRGMALKRHWVAPPRDDRWHGREVPVMGGIAMFAALTLALLVTFPDRRALLGWWVGAAVVFSAGLIDDARGLIPALKLAAQTCAAGIAVTAGLTLPGLDSWLGIALIVFWIVAVTNAFNLLDNMDGLAAGTTVVCSLALFAQGQLALEPGVAIPCLALTGTALGFLIQNRHPARIFMGDCGSMLLGFSLAVFSLMGSSASAPGLLVALVFPCVVLAVPLFDTCFVTVMRTLHGRPIAEGGRDHTSHRLVYLGLSETRTVSLLWGLSVLVAILALIGKTTSEASLLTAAVIVVAGFLALGRRLARIEVYGARARPALIVGADATGVQALRALRRDRALNLQPVGFVTVDPEHFYRRLDGLPVMGGPRALGEIVNAYGVQELIIAAQVNSNGLVEEVVSFCHERGLVYREFAGSMGEPQNGHRGNGAEGEI